MPLPVIKESVADSAKMMGWTVEEVARYVDKLPWCIAVRGHRSSEWLYWVEGTGKPHKRVEFHLLPNCVHAIRVFPSDMDFVQPVSLLPAQDWQINSHFGIDWT